jgi:PAS domain S-box-containing protein
VDYGVFAAVGFAAFGLLRLWLRRLGPPDRGVWLFWLLLPVVLLVGWHLTELAGRAERGRMQQMLEGIAPTYAAEMERMGHARLRLGGAWDADLYGTLLDAQRRWLDANRQVADIYTFRRTPGGVVHLLVDSETDYDRDGAYRGARESRTVPGEPYESPPAELVAALDGRPGFTETVYSDRWGAWVSAFVPMRDEAGEVEAVLGVDFDASEWSAAIRRARMRIIAVVGLLVLAVAFFHAVFVLMQRDLRRRRALQVELEARVAERTADLKRLATVVEQASEAVILTDADGVIRYVNPAFERMTGYAADEAVGKTPALVRSDRHPPEFFEALWKELRAGRTWNGRFTNRRKDGSLVETAAVISPLQDSEGRISGYAALEHDVTAEVRLEAQLRQAQKMEAVGLLAGGIAHDFNNLLTAITGYTDLLAAEAPPGGSAARDLEEIRSAARQAAALTRQLLAFSRRQVVEPRVLDLDGLLGDMDRFLRRLAGESVEVVVRPGAGGARVEADPAQLQQVVLNLVFNARDAMPAGGRLMIETAVVRIDAAEAAGRPDVRSGEHVVLSVIDTGIGMSAETQAHLFEPFFTTKERGRGTGLGLATVHGIVTQSGGHVEVTSEPGRGSTFRVFLPRCERPSDTIPPPRPTPSPDRGAETVLLVEDEPLVRGFAERVLRKQGYRVVPAVDGAEALRILDALEEPVDLLLSDVMMPGGIDGPTLAVRVRERLRGLPVVLMSGHADDAIRPRLGRGGSLPFLHKPFSPEELARIVRKTLDRGGPSASAEAGSAES